MWGNATFTYIWGLPRSDWEESSVIFKRRPGFCPVASCLLLIFKADSYFVSKIHIMANYDHKQVRGNDHVESLKQVQTHLGTDETESLTEEHRQYLIQRHGSFELDPMPDASDADPYNWSASKV